jgi:hypothetical protein
LTFEECDERLLAGWHVDFDYCCDRCSARRKRYLRVENERLASLVRTRSSYRRKENVATT